jgi:hypothetical protein
MRVSGLHGYNYYFLSGAQMRFLRGAKFMGQCILVVASVVLVVRLGYLLAEGIVRVAEAIGRACIR